ncbi:MAG: ferric reductase-like transmembrane domain-containing protein [Chlamydiota bacterium]|jgi:predicted ferric reductase
MKRKSLWIALLLACIPLIEGVFQLFPRWMTRQTSFQLLSLGSIIGAAGYILFSLSMIFAAKVKKMEKIIGPLDQIYHYHHYLGVSGGVAIILHPLILAFKQYWNGYSFWGYLFPIEHRASLILGSIAYWLFIFILLVTLLKVLPYDKWKIIHKGMSISYLLAFSHFLSVNSRFSYFIITQSVLYLLSFGTILTIFYQQIYYPFFLKRQKAEVVRIDKLSNKIMEIHLKVVGKGFSYRPGQFAFFRFFKANLTKESHPFTLCSHHEEKHLRILVKDLGDFTHKLYKNLTEGTKVDIEGPWGTFNYKKGGNRQIWIAGGVGIAPFLSWARRMHIEKDTTRKVDLYYCFHDKKDQVYLKEFEKIHHRIKNLKIRFICTAEKGHLTAEQIQEISGKFARNDIYMCGPKRMTKDFLKQFKSLGVRRTYIHYEDFEFF